MNSAEYVIGNKAKFDSERLTDVVPLEAFVLKNGCKPAVTKYPSITKQHLAASRYHGISSRVGKIQSLR